MAGKRSRLAVKIAAWAAMGFGVVVIVGSLFTFELAQGAEKRTERCISQIPQGGHLTEISTSRWPPHITCRYRTSSGNEFSRTVSPLPMMGIGSLFVVLGVGGLLLNRRD